MTPVQMLYHCYIGIIGFILCTITVDCRPKRKNQSDEEALIEYLFKDYNPSARPVLNSSKTVTVDIQFSLLQIQELNVRNQVFTTTGLLILDWMDERLTWNSSVNSLDTLVLHSKYIWKPEFAAINGAEAIYEDYSEFQAVLHPNGRVRWEPGGVFKTMCQIDITYYPFDEQRCELIFGAWSYYTSKMNLTTHTLLINLDTYEKNGEWQILKTDVKRREFNFECCPDQKFSNVAFGIYIRRRSTFYIMNVILPGILTSAVLLSIFFCTPSQKVHIGVAALLSFRLFLLNVADTIPRTSDHVPLLGIYLTCTMAITTLAMVATVFVLNLYGMKEKPVPYWAKRFLIHYMGRVLCMCNCLGPPDEPPSRQRDSDTARNAYVLHKKGKHKYKLIAHKQRQNNTLHPKTDGITAEPNCDTNDPLLSSDNGTEPSSTNASPLNHPLFVRRKSESKTKDTRPDYAKDWVHVAAVFDRLFFWLCLLFILITTLLLFHPLTTSRYFNIPIIDQHKKPSE